MPAERRSGVRPRQDEPVVATGLVSLYNVMPPCSDVSRPPPLCYNQYIADVVNKGLAAAASAIELAERIFAASNTDGDARLRAANVAQAVIAEVMRNLTKFGLTQLKGAS